MMPDLRNNQRVIWQSEKETWGPLWERIKHAIPDKVQYGGFTWRPISLNERLRFYRCKYAILVNFDQNTC
jgi:hypothetical protein